MSPNQTHHVNTSNRGGLESARSELFGKILEGSAEPDTMKVEFQREDFLKDHGAEQIPNSIPAERMLEEFSPKEASRFFGLAASRLDAEVLAEPEAENALMIKILKEAGQGKDPKPVAERYMLSVSPDTTDLDRLGLADDPQTYQETAAAILAGEIRISDGSLAGETNEQKQEARKLARKAEESLRREAKAEFKASVMKSPDSLLDAADKKREFLINKHPKAEYIEHYALNTGEAGEALDQIGRDAQELVGLETFSELYLCEKEEIAESIAEVKTTAVEIIGSCSPVDFGTGSFSIAEAQTRIEEELEKAKGNHFAQVLGKISGFEKAETNHVFAKKPEHEISGETREELERSLKVVVLEEIGKHVRLMNGEDEITLWNQFMKGSKVYEDLVEAMAHEQELLNQIGAVSAGSEIAELEVLGHLLAELTVADAKKDKLYIDCLEEYGFLRCEYKGEKLRASRSANREEIAATDKALSEIKKVSKRTIEIPAGTIQPAEVIKVELVEDVNQARDHLIETTAHYNHLQQSRKKAEKHQGILSRLWNIPRSIFARGEK